MDFTINELSLSKLSSLEEAKRVLKTFSDTASSLSTVGFRSIKIWDRNHLLNFEFFNDFTIIKWLKKTTFESNSEKIKSQILKSIVTKKSSIWSQEEIDLIADCPIIGIQIVDKQHISEGLKIACIFSTIAVSFDTAKIWDTHHLDLIHLTEDEDQNQSTIEQSITIKHASKTFHIDYLKDWLHSLNFHGHLKPNWKPSSEFFPNLGFSNLLVEDGLWENYYKKRDSTTSHGERQAMIIEYGQRVAERNFYSIDKRLSEFNSSDTRKRFIFGAGIGKDRIYLSIDLEKGGFEVCNYKGDHLGEYFFNGTKTGISQSSHNIRIRK